MVQKIALTRLLPCNGLKQLRMTSQTQLSKNSALGDSLRSNTPTTNVTENVTQAPTGAAPKSHNQRIMDLAKARTAANTT